EMSSTTIDEYRDAMQGGAKFPPVECVEGEDGVLLWGGFHRRDAALRLGRKSMLCNVRPGRKSDAVLLAAGANIDHGLRRTVADKRCAVRLLLDHPEAKKWSARRIAGHTGTTHPFVLSMIAERKEGGNVTTQETLAAEMAAGNVATETAEGTAASP